MKSKDENNLYTKVKDISRRWSTYFSEILNRESDTAIKAIDCIEKKFMMKFLDDISTMGKVQKAIIQLNLHKATGKDAIPTEILSLMVSNNFQVMCYIWRKIVADRMLRSCHFKGKIHADCDKCKAIAMLCTSDKILVSFYLIFYLIEYTVNTVDPESQ